MRSPTRQSSSAGPWPISRTRYRHIISHIHHTPNPSPPALASKASICSRRHPKSTAALRIFQDASGNLPVTRSSIQLSAWSNANISRALQHGWATPTLVGYGQALRRFLAFCDKEHVPSSFRLPTDDFVLCAFAASFAGNRAGSTLRNSMSALKAWHTLQGVEWQGTKRLHYVMNGVHSLAPESSRRSPRPPITTAMLQCLHRNLDLSSPFDAAVFACACIAFWCQCRLGELLPTSSLSPVTHIPQRRHIRKSTNPAKTRLIHLPRTKVSKHGEDVALVSQDPPICPVRALERHLLLNPLPSHYSLFTYNSPRGSTQLSRPKFLERCNTIWSAAGYPRSTGHSFRIGGTTELLLAGVPPDVVKALGRWSSDSFHRYWRALDELAPAYIKNIRR